MSFDSSTPYGKIVVAPDTTVDYEYRSFTIGVYAPQNHPYHQSVNPFIYAGDHLRVLPNPGWIGNSTRNGDVVYFNVPIPGQPYDSTVNYTVYADKGESDNQGYWDSVVVTVYRPDRPDRPSGSNRP